VLSRGAAEVSELHCGAGETSRQMYLNPHLVKLDRAVDVAVDVTSEMLDYVGVGGVSPEGVWGYPSGATADEGRRLVERAADNVAEYVRTTLARIEPIRRRGDHKRSPKQRG